MCFSEDSNADACSSKTTCASGTGSFTLTSTNGTKTVYAFVYDSGVNAATSNDTIVLDTNSPSYAVSGVIDGNYYTDRNFTITINASESVGFDYNRFTFSGDHNFSVVGGATSIAATLGATNLTDGSYTITIDVNDLAGNRTTGSVSWTVDNNAPYGGSISAVSTWTNSSKPTFTISESHHSGTTGLKMAFSCNNSSWTAWVSYATSYSDFNMRNTSYGCSSSDANNTIYVKFKDAAGNADVNTYRAIQLYDGVAPSAPTNLSASPGNGKVNLNWTVPVADNNSGNYRVYIYKNGSYIADVNYGTITYEASGLTNGTTYTFKLTTKDNAGNESAFSSESSAIPASATASIGVKKDGLAAEYAKSGDTLSVTCTYSSSSENAKIKYAYYNPSSSTNDLKTSTAGVTSLSENIVVASGTNYEKLGLWCESSTTSTSVIHFVIIDNTSPTISWLDSNELFVGVRKVAVSANDNKYLEKVEFEINSEKIAAQKDSNNNFYIDLNSLKYENKEYSLKARAYDKTGNTKEITRTIRVNNELSVSQKAGKMIEDAKIKQLAAADLKNYYLKEGLIFSAELETLKGNADALLSQAESLLTNDANTSLTSAANAYDLFTEFNSKAAVEISGTKTYSYDVNTLALILKEIGFAEKKAIEEQEKINLAGVERKLFVVKAGSETKKQVKIEISFTNDSNQESIKIIEIIPKEFVDSAKKLYSDFNFRIIKDDPIIEFSVAAQKGTKTTIIYSLGEIENAKAQAFIDNNIIQKLVLRRFCLAPMKKRKK
jgi:hypothetical protein